MPPGHQPVMNQARGVSSSSGARGVRVRCALCLAVAGFRLAELAVWIALTAYAYTAGGVREASAVTVAELVPATAFALAVGRLIRRHGATSVLRWGLAAQSARMLVAAVFLHQGVNIGAFLAAIITASAVTTTRPAQSTAVPSLVDGPDERGS